jgi:hypothetical protein
LSQSRSLADGDRHHPSQAPSAASEADMNDMNDMNDTPGLLLIDERCASPSSETKLASGGCASEHIGSLNDARGGIIENDRHTDNEYDDINDQVLFSIGFFVGGLNKEQRNRAKACDIILATTVEAGEGMDIPRIDTVIEASPHSSVEQSFGRGLRRHPLKNTPEFVYFADQHEPFEGRSYSVMRYCQSESWTVQWENIE